MMMKGGMMGQMLAAGESAAAEFYSSLIPHPSSLVQGEAG
jgi:hypothetical protein